MMKKKLNLLNILTKHKTIHNTATVHITQESCDHGILFIAGAPPEQQFLRSFSNVHSEWVSFKQVNIETYMNELILRLHFYNIYCIPCPTDYHKMLISKSLNTVQNELENWWQVQKMNKNISKFLKIKYRISRPIRRTGP
jgi:hypothetical protein